MMETLKHLGNWHQSRNTEHAYQAAALPLDSRVWNITHFAKW